MSDQNENGERRLPMFDREEGSGKVDLAESYIGSQAQVEEAYFNPLEAPAIELPLNPRPVS